MRNIHKNVLIILFLLIFPTVTFASANYMEGKVVIEKDTNFNGNWVIKEGTTLIIKEKVNCVFRGGVKFNGKKNSPITIYADKSSNIIFEKCNDVILKYVKVSGVSKLEFNESSGMVENCDLDTCNIGFKAAKNSKITITKCSIKHCEIGFISELKATAELNDVNFTDNNKAVIASQSGSIDLKNSVLRSNKVGFYVNNDAHIRVKNCNFQENEAGIILHQNEGALITESIFSKNKVAAYAEVMTTLTILNNTFTENKEGVKLVQFVGGSLKGNTFQNNDTAIYLEKKSSPDIRLNTLKGNKVGIFCDFSSYPVITLNNFFANNLHIKLGIYQSSDFENRVGSLQIQIEEANAKKTKRILDFNKQKKLYIGEVFAKKNYWDERTLKEMETYENISSIYDGHDLPSVKYDGYGEEQYLLDYVVFKPFLKTPIKNNEK